VIYKWDQKCLKITCKRSSEDVHQTIDKFWETSSCIILNPNVKFCSITQLQAPQNSIGVSANSEEISPTPKRTSHLLFASCSDLVLHEHFTGLFDKLFLEECCIMTMFEWLYTHYSQIKNTLELVCMWFCTGNARASVQEFWQVFPN